MLIKCPDNLIVNLKGINAIKEEDNNVVIYFKNNDKIILHYENHRNAVKAIKDITEAYKMDAKVCEIY